MSLHLAQKGGTQLTAPQENSAVFTAMQYADPQRNAFNLSCQTHGTLEYGKIYPVYSRMLFPGDSIKCKASHFVRFASVLSPILNKTYITYAAFFVPFRLVWKYWPTYISGGYNNDGVYTDANGNYLDKNDEYTTTPFKPQIPRVSITLNETLAHDEINPVFNFLDGSLADWLGFPTFDDKSFVSNLPLMNYYKANAIKNPMALPFMCYQKVINDYFTNPNIKDTSRLYALPPTSVSGNLDKKYRSVTELATVNYGMDYFTSCLPYLQRGDTFTLERTDSTITFDEYPKGGGSPLITKIKALTPNPKNDKIGLNDSENTNWQDLITLGTDPLNYSAVMIDNSRNLSVSLHSTISELRYLNALQRFQEKSLRAGTRYVDFLKCFFGVKSSDKSLQRSEYLGAKVTEISKEDINQTSATDTNTTPLGTVASKMLGVANTQSFNCYAEENGMFFVFAFVTPETIYKNRFKTEYLYEDKEDFLFPEFTHLSPQAVKLAELWCPRSTSGDTSADLSRTFGYQDRYNELRCDMNSVHGDFKNNLSFFLQMRDFGSAPYLNTSFLSAKDIDTSIFATDKVKDKEGNEFKVNHIWASFDFDVKAVRCLPKLSTPSLI